MENISKRSGSNASSPTITLDGQPHAELTQRLISLIAEETTNGVYRCEAVFSNWGPVKRNVGYLYPDRSELDFGTSISIGIGEVQKKWTIFEGRITGIEGRYPVGTPPEIAIHADDRLEDLRTTRRTRTFEMVSDSDIFAQIATDHNLNPQIDLNGPTYSVLTQANQSDLAFLRERAHAIDAEIWVEGQTLHAQFRSDRKHGTRTLAYGQNLHSFSTLADTANQRTSLTVDGYDVSAKEGISFTADEHVIKGELGDDESGISIVKQAFGTRSEKIVHVVPFSNAEAKFSAVSNFRRMARRFVTGRGKAVGDGRIRVGTHVNLKGLGPLFEGTYYINEVRHIYNNVEGYTIEFVVDRLGLPASPRHKRTTI